MGQETDRGGRTGLGVNIGQAWQAAEGTVEEGDGGTAWSTRLDRCWREDAGGMGTSQCFPCGSPLPREKT